MKKLILFILLSILMTGCALKKPESQVSIIVPNGIPLIAVGDLIGEENIKIESVTGPALLQTALVSKSHDIIIAPLNIGAKLYIDGGSKYKLAAVLTSGNTYIVSRKENKLDSINDLQNEEIMAYGKGAAPGIVLEKALESINANITYKDSVDTILPLFVTKNETTPKYILTAEPVIQKLQKEFKIDLNILDLQEVLKSEIEFIPQAAIFVHPDKIDNADVIRVLKLIEANVNNLNKNPLEYAKKIVSKHVYFTNLKEEFIASSIPNSDINYSNSKDNKAICEKYFELLNAFNEKLLGNKKPDNAFYICK